MRVLHVINNLGSGGAEKLLCDIVPLMAINHKVEVEVLLLSSENNTFENQLRSKGVKIQSLNQSSLFNFKIFFKLLKKIKNEKIQIVHAHLFPTFYWIAFVSLFTRKKDVKFVLTEHSTMNNRRKYSFLRPLERLVYRQFDTIITINDQVRVKLRDWIHSKYYDESKYPIIYNGISLDYYKNSNKYDVNALIKNVKSEDVKLVCMVGRLFRPKDQETVVMALTHLPSNVHLLLVGEGERKEKLTNLVNELEIQDRVHFLGFRHDIAEILKTVDIVVLSSLWEGFGLAALEGMAAGKAVVGSDVDGLRDIIRDSDLLFPVGDYIRLSEIIKRLLQDRALYDKKVKILSDRCQHFDIERTVKSYVREYSLLSREV